MSDENEEAGQLADYDLFALERNYPEAYAPYRMAIRIAELEATVARLTAKVTEEELRRLDDDWSKSGDDTIEAYRPALTAFLERRMKG